MDINRRITELEEAPDRGLVSQVAAKSHRPQAEVWAELRKLKACVQQLRARHGNDVDKIVRELAAELGIGADALRREAERIVADGGRA